MKSLFARAVGRPAVTQEPSDAPPLIDAAIAAASVLRVTEL
jgi:hypothetical protein